MDGWIDRLIGWMEIDWQDRWTDRLIEWMDRQIDRMDGQIDWQDGWRQIDRMDGQIDCQDGWIDRLIGWIYRLMTVKVRMVLEM